MTEKSGLRPKAVEVLESFAVTANANSDTERVHVQADQYLLDIIRELDPETGDRAARAFDIIEKWYA